MANAIRWVDGQYGFPADAAAVPGDVIIRPDGSPSILTGLESVRAGDLIQPEPLFPTVIVEVDCASSTVFAAGADVYWDAVAKLAVTTSSGNVRLGTAARAKTSGQSAVRVNCSSSAAAPLTPTNTYLVRGFSDSNYFAGANNEVLAKLGTCRIVLQLLSQPNSTQKVVCGRTDNLGNGGWYIATGNFGLGNAFVLVQRTVGGSLVSPAYSTNAADVGKFFVLHATADSTALRLFVGGAEIANGQATGTNPTDARTTDQFWIGRFQHAGGLANDHVGIVDISLSPTVMTHTEIAADAQAIQSRLTNLVVPSIAGQTDRFNANDIAATANWLSQSSVRSLTRNGSLTVETF